MMLKKYLLILVGSVSFLFTIAKSGYEYNYGLGFWGANGHDGIWHIALAESLLKGSLSNPVFAGTAIQNYHIGFDLLLVLFHKLTGISISVLYFQVLPVIFSISIGYLVYTFVENWTKSQKSALYATFFTYFGGSFAYLIGKGESAFWSQQAVSTLINPPYALSLILTLLGLVALLKQKNIFAIILFGLLIEVKVYAAVLVLGGLLVSKNYKVFLGSLFVSLVLYFSLGDYSGNLIIFKPFWFLESMMGLTDHVGFTKFGEAMLNYRAGHNYIKGILAYGAAFAIFIMGNFGTRILFAKNIFHKLDYIKIFMISIIGAGIVIPTFFVQSGTPWNTIQFLYYSLFFSGILAGISLSHLKSKTVIIAIVLITIPTTLLTLKDVYIPNRPPAKLSTDELNALRFLSAMPDGVVLTYPFDEFKSKEAISNPPRPLYLYVSTAYVSAFSKHQTYLEDEVNLDITGYDWKSRRREIDNWYKEPDQVKARKFLKDKNIKYVYWVKPQRALLGETQLGLKKVFENNEVDIYMVE